MFENGALFTPVKYTLVCRTPWVSWASQHTTVCLDAVTRKDAYPLPRVDDTLQAHHGFQPWINEWVLAS